MSSQRRSRTPIVATVAAIAVAVGLAVIGRSDGARSHREVVTALASVMRVTLSSEVSADGVLQYAAQPDGWPYTVVNHASGVLTALPSPGQVIHQGQVLYRVAGKPVVLLDGATPAYRTLSEGATGADVRQLNTGLVELGYATRSELDPSSDYFDPATAYALERLQAHVGADQTGSLTLGEAVFLPTPLRITRVLATLGTGGASAPNGGSGGPHNASWTPRPHAEFVDLATSSTTPATTAPPTSTTSTTTIAASPQPAPSTNPTARDRKRCGRHKHHRCEPRKRKHRRHHRRKPNGATRPHRPRRPVPGAAHGGQPSPASGGRPGQPANSPHQPVGGGGPGHGRPGSSHRGGGTPGGSSNGGGGAPAQPILEATSTKQEVLVNVDATELAAVKVGDRVAITLPDGKTTPGVVARIGTVATNGSGTSTVPIYIAVDHPHAAGSIDQAPVQVRITTATVRHALAVPVTALLEMAPGRFGIDAIDARRARRVVPVAVGVFDDAKGLVQVRSPTLLPGQQILVSASGTRPAATKRPPHGEPPRPISD